MDIEKRIRHLSEQKRRKLDIIISYVVDIPYWCESRKIDPSKPDKSRVKEVLYEEMYE